MPSKYHGIIRSIQVSITHNRLIQLASCAIHAGAVPEHELQSRIRFPDADSSCGGLPLSACSVQ
jgi:hypothetical protein